MKTEKKRFGIPGKGLIAVCILAHYCVCFKYYYYLPDAENGIHHL